MVAYLLVAPIAGSVAEKFSRKAWIIYANVMRIVAILMLPFVSEVWHVFVIIFLINSATAAYTPIYQALIADVLPNEKDYNVAMGYSRIAFDLESLVSPMLAVFFLLFMPFEQLFIVTGISLVFALMSFLLSAIPTFKANKSLGEQSVFNRLFFGIKCYTGTPRLRGLLGLHWVVSCGSSMTIVNTVVYVREYLSLSEDRVGLTLAAAGSGAMLIAFIIPRFLDQNNIRKIMVCSAGVSVATLFSISLLPSYAGMLVLWFIQGMAISGILTPSGLLLRMSCSEKDRTAYFSSNFALSHGLWFFAYLGTGWIAATIGIANCAVLMAIASLVGLLYALSQWPKERSFSLEHRHDLDSNNMIEHVEAHGSQDITRRSQQIVHTHHFVLDENHKHWPSKNVK
ncbi:MFS transporter [Enterovibrio nigricans]|nr:MFS transporter [Enterovibrio nigricans]PKF49266.1 MFS transporter [Enterovibrio nigricans]